MRNCAASLAKTKVKAIFACLVFGAVMTNIWLTKNFTEADIGEAFIKSFRVNDLGAIFGFNSAKIKQNLLRNISRPFLSSHAQNSLEVAFDGHSDAPLVKVLEETAMYRLRQIMDQTDSLMKQVKKQGSQIMIPGFPAQIVPTKEKIEPPLGKNYPARSFKRFCTDNVVLNQPDFVTLGHIKPNIFLAIGIATVSRPQESYLDTTLAELFSKASPGELQDVAIIVFLADLDDDKAKNAVKSKLKSSFPKQLNDGSLLVIEAPKAFYPPLTGLKRNFNDNSLRVYWRAKQCIDFSFIFSFAHNISRYYLHLEDDVVTKQGYVATIKDTARDMNDAIFEVEFSVLGFIAKMFRSSDLLDLAAFHFFNYEEMPVDMLQPIYLSLISPNMRMPVTHYPSLFQHKGKSSSLKGKKQSAQDPFFDSHRSFLNRRNHGVFSFTNIPFLGANRPENPLAPSGMFHSKLPPKVGDFYTIYLDQPRVIEYILIATGDKNHPSDHAIGAEVMYSSELGERMRKRVSCGNKFTRIGDFEHPVFAQNLTQFGQIGCIKIQFSSPVSPGRKELLLISEIIVAFPGNMIGYQEKATTKNSTSGHLTTLAFALRNMYSNYVERGYKYI